MKNIQEYLVNQPMGHIGGPVVNEVFGLLFASAMIAWAMKDNIKGLAETWSAHQQAKWKHQEDMMNKSMEAKKDGEGMAKAAGGMGLLALIGKSIFGIKDPVEQEKQKSRLDLIRSSYVDENGKERTPEERQKWLQTNMSPEDYESMCKEGMESFVKADTKGVADAMEKEGAKLTDDDIAKETEAAKKAYNELGKELEADAENRRKLQAEIKQKQDEKQAKQEALDKAISDATASGDEAAIKQAKLDKAEFNKKMDEEIYQAQKKANDFDANCPTAAKLNAANPGREERIKEAATKLDEDHKKAVEAANKEITDAGGDPKNTDPASQGGNGGGEDPAAKAVADAKAAAAEAAEQKAAADKAVADAEAALSKDPDNEDLKNEVEKKKKEAEEAGKKAEDLKKKADDAEKTAQAAKGNGEPDPEATKKAEAAKKAAEEAAEAKKKADDDVAAAEKALKDNTDDTKKEALQRDLDDKKKVAVEAGKKAEETKKAAEEAAKATQTTEPAKTEPAKTEPAKTEPAGGKEGETKTEEIPGYDADGDTDGTKWVKTTDKDGNESYTLVDKDGKKLDASKEDFEKAKKDHEENSKRDDETNGDDEKGGDLDANDNDVDAEEVDDGKGGKKKVLKNPAQIWHRKRNKATGKPTKSYYNKAGDSISQKEFQEKMQRYKAKAGNSSFQEFLRNPFVMERVSKYTSLRDRMRASIHD